MVDRGEQVKSPVAPHPLHGDERPLQQGFERISKVIGSRHPRGLDKPGEGVGLGDLRRRGAGKRCCRGAVSYTHLTLPTKA